MKPLSVLLSWSSGKDSAWALHELLGSGQAEVVGLLTTFNAANGRVSMHGVRRELVERQAEILRLPLLSVDLPDPCPDAVYEETMRGVIAEAVGRGVEAVAFGDLFLEDVRRYRERRLAHSGLRPLFPLWKLPTWDLAMRMIGAGVRARVTAIDLAKMPLEMLGRDIDRSFLTSLPEDVDPCGENGEFHTFAFDGPMFREPIPLSTGEVVVREQFAWIDLVPE